MAEEKAMMGSLWPSIIKAGILPPSVILREQANALRTQTSNVLEGRIETGSEQVGKRKMETLTLVLVAPSLDYSVPIVTLLHDEGLPYPLLVDAAIFEGDFDRAKRYLSEGTPWTSSFVRDKASFVESSNALIKALENVFASPTVVSTAQSLIARATETLMNAEQTVP